jgi:hypothetical protein
MKFLVLLLCLSLNSLAYSLDEECVDTMVTNYGELHRKWLGSSKHSTKHLHDHNKANLFCQCVNDRLIHNPNANADRLLIDCSSLVGLFEEISI